MSRVLWRVLLPLSLIVAIAVVHSSRALFAAPAPPSSALDALDALRARAPLAAPLVAPNAPGPPLSTERVGFYLRVGEQAGVAIQQVKEVRKVYPKARIFVLSDGGVDLSGFCKKLKCSFVLCPPANDAWHPWPFFRRLYDAALALNTEFLVLLDPAVRLDAPLAPLPGEVAAAGRLWTRPALVEEDYIESLGRRQHPTFRAAGSLLAADVVRGGLLRTEAVLDALADEQVMKIDWNRLAAEDASLFAAPVALHYALAARGWRVAPAAPAAPAPRGLVAREVPVAAGLAAEEEELVGPKPAEYEILNGDCQMCYSLTRYVANWGSARCTNRLEFNYSQSLMDRHYPERAQGPCQLPTLCKVEGNLQREMDSNYGFYLHVYADPAAVIFQVRQLRKFFPRSPIHVMSDGGMDFSPLCKQQGCTFELCPPANDRWHPWPFLKRLLLATLSLKTDFVIMLEPDNTIHGPIKREPKHDAGGIFVEDRAFGLVEYVEKLAQERVPGFKWTRTAMSAGLAGGAYFRREAILDAFSDENMMKLDWNMLGEKATKEIYSSDFAMQYALAARGWRIAPWEETAQMDKDKDVPLTGPKDAAFRHYCSCYPGGKPTYNIRLKKEDAKLALDQPAEFSKVNSVCQLCYNLSRYVALWGSARCTNEIPFSYSKRLLQRYHPEVLQGACELPWLCTPTKPD